MKKLLSKVLSVFTIGTIMLGTSAFMPETKVEARVNGTANFSKNYTLTGDGAKDMVSIAMAQLNKTGGQLGYSSEEWCADLISDCAILAGQTAAIPANAYCPTLITKIKNAGGYSVSKSSAKPGDIIFFYSGCAHVGLVTRNANGVLYTVEGNTGNSVNSKSIVNNFTVSSRYVYDIVRPNYKNSVVVPDVPAVNGYTQTANSVTVKWNAVKGATKYNVQRRHKGDDSKVYLGTVTGTSFKDTGLLTNQGYYYYVSAVGNGGESKYSSAYLAYTKGKIANLGNDFSAIINNTNYWKPMYVNDDGTVTINTEKNTTYNRTLFHFIRNNNGTYAIWSYYNGKKMYVDGGKGKNGAKIKVGNAPNAESAEWYVMQRDNGSLLIRSRCSERSVDLSGNNKANGTPIVLYDSNDSNAQVWSVYKMDKSRDKINYSISTAKTSVATNKNVKVTVGGKLPYVYSYKFHIVAPNGKETVVDNKSNPVYSFKSNTKGKYVIYAELKNPLNGEKGSKSRKAVTITVK